MRVLGEREIHMQKNLLPCFIVYEKAFDNVRYKPLFDLLIETGLELKDARLLQELFGNKQQQ